MQYSAVMQAGSRYGYLGYLQLHQRILHLHFPCTNGIFNSSSANQNPALTPLQHVRSAAAQRPRWSDMTHDRSGGGHDEGQSFTNSSSLLLLLLLLLTFRSAKAATAAGRATRFKLPHPRFLLSTNPVSKLLQPALSPWKCLLLTTSSSSSEMIRVDLDASKKLLFNSSKNQSDRSCSGFSLISSRSINSGLLLLATDHHVVEEESKTTRKTPAFSNSVNSWDFLSSSSCFTFFWESVSSCSSLSRPGRPCKWELRLLLLLVQ